MSSDILHQWIYVIIPVTREGNVSTTHPMFCAFCKGCRNYFTEKVSTMPNGKAYQTQGSLPKYGCEPIDDIPDVSRLS